MFIAVSIKMFDIQVKEKKETRTFTLKHLFYQQIDAEDEKTLETFMSSQPTERKTLADIIMEKINEKKIEIRSQIYGRLHTCSKSTIKTLEKGVKYVHN